MEQPPAVQAFLLVQEVFRGKKSGSRPHQGSDHRVNNPESIRLKGQAADQESAQAQAVSAVIQNCQEDRKHKLQHCKPDGGQVAELLVLSSQDIG